MVDIASIAAGMAVVKGGFDAARTALGLVKDVQGILPEGEKKEAVSRTLEEAERQIRLGEAQIAQGLGFPLCTCAFPPTPMLKVGYRRSPSPAGLRTMEHVVHECPRCRQTDAFGHTIHRGVPGPGQLPGAAGA